MLYLTGVYALNIENSSNTCGNWHTSSLNWRNIELVESSNSIFQEWGIINVNKNTIKSLLS